MKRQRAIFLPVMLSASFLTNCLFVAEEDEDDLYHHDVHHRSSVTPRLDLQPTPPKKSEQTKDQHRPASQCWKKYEGLPLPDFNPSEFDASCANKACVSVPVTLTYLLSEPILGPQTAIIEAFESPYFFGAPEASTTIFGFNPTNPGVGQTSTLDLPPGEYYVRAYLGDPSRQLPYSYQDLNLVGETPVGYYSASSTPKKMTVLPKTSTPCPNAIEVYLDKLFEDPDKQPATEAKARIKIEAPIGAIIPDQRKLWIELHDTDDFAAVPAHRYSIPSQSLLIHDRYGKAEYVTPNLELGQYFVFVYIDDDQNEFFDQGELHATYAQSNIPIPLNIREKRVATISLMLGL